MVFLSILSFLGLMTSILLILSFSLKRTASLYFPFFSVIASCYAAGVDDSHLPLCALPPYALCLGPAPTSFLGKNNFCTAI